MKSGKVLLGVLAGAAVGAIAGILFAPDKGSRTRRQIMDKSDNYAEGLKEKFEDMTTNLTKKYSNAMQEVDSLVSKGKNKYNQAMHEVDQLVSTGKSKVMDHKNETV
jgi:gas vesicle protein